MQSREKAMTGRDADKRSGRSKASKKTARVAGGVLRDLDEDFEKMQKLLKDPAQMLDDPDKLQRKHDVAETIVDLGKRLKAQKTIMEEGEIMAKKMYIKLRASMIDQRSNNYGVSNEAELVKHLKRAIRKYVPVILEREKGEAVRQELKILDLSIILQKRSSLFFTNSFKTESKSAKAKQFR